MRYLLLLITISVCQLALAQSHQKIRVNMEVVDSLPVYTEEIDSNGVLYSTRSYYDMKKTRLASIRYFKNGVQNGIYKTYFPEGGLMEFAVYGNGIRHGEYTNYNKDGTIAVKGKYKNDLRHGYWAFKNDDCFGRYKNGKKKGTWRCYKDFKEIKTKY